MCDMENMFDIKNMSNIEDFINEINKKIKKAIKKIEKNNELLLIELKDLILNYNIRTYKNITLV